MANFIRDERGVTAIEYALLAALVAVGMILALQFMGQSLASNFNEVASGLEGAGGGGGGPSPT
jgi:pilus assembly protein Flp/PilA